MNNSVPSAICVSLFSLSLTVLSLSLSPSLCHLILSGAGCLININIINYRNTSICIARSGTLQSMKSDDCTLLKHE